MDIINKHTERAHFKKYVENTFDNNSYQGWSVPNIASFGAPSGGTWGRMRKGSHSTSKSYLCDKFVKRWLAWFAITNR